MIRHYRIRDNRIQYIKLIPFKNHSKNNYYERIVGSTFSDWCFIKGFLGKIWVIFGVKI